MDDNIDFYKLFKLYMGNKVIENEHMMKPLYHSFVGSFLPVHYVYAGSYNTPRLHTFLISQSGSGKSMAMKSLHFLQRGCDIDSHMTTKMTDAALLGTMDLNRKGNPKPYYGLLKNKRAIIWDEGRNLFKPDQHYSSVRDTLNMAMDEPGGWVSKTLRHGTIEYDSPTTIVAGSYMIGEFKESILQEGFFQRFFICYKEHSQEELDRIDDKIKDLKMTDYIKCVKPLVDQIREWKDEILQKAERYKKGKAKKPYIEFCHEDLDEMQALKQGLRNEFYRWQFTDTKRDILNSYYSRVDTLISKIAAQRAVINMKAEIEKDDYKYGTEIVKEHSKSVIELIGTIGQIKAGVRQDRGRKLLDIIKDLIVKGSGVTTRNVILGKLKEMKEKRVWDVGSNGSLKMINELSAKGTLIEKKGPKNEKLIIGVKA